MLKNSNENLALNKKFELLKNNLKSIKIDWQQGCCYLQLSREKSLEESIKQMEQINIYKELKINFKGEVSYDAGGIIREWFTIIFKDLLSENQKLFQRSEDDQISYIFHNDIDDTYETHLKIQFIGKLFAKSLLENITINSCLNKVFFKVLLNEKIDFSDLVFIDKKLYHSLKEIENFHDIEDLGLYFIVNYEKKGKIYTEELKENGNNIAVTKNNFREYIDKRIEFLIKKNISFYNTFRSSFITIIIENFISIFNSDELELIINGTPFIDIEDWKENTIYQNLNPNDNVVVWFWT